MTAYDLMNENPVLASSTFLIASALVLNAIKYVLGYAAFKKNLSKELPIDQVWAYERCFCLHETGFEVVSLHETKELAESAMHGELNKDIYSDGMRVRLWSVELEYDE